MKLVVGLGNPGRRYVGTRHNIGYAVIDRLAEKYGPSEFRRQLQGRTANLTLAGHKLLLLKPETYMNRSGHAVQNALAYYKLDPSQLLVICDDINLPLGKLRVRARGSDGGQKGLRSVAEQLGTLEYGRLRIGIDAAPAGRDASDYVLQQFTAHERKVIDEAVDRAVQAVGVWCQSGIEECMNQFN